MLMTIAADDPEAQPRFAAFRQGLQRLGWTDGRDVRVDTRWFPGDAANARKPGPLALYRRHAGGEEAHRSGLRSSSTSRTGVSGTNPPRRRARVSLPFSSQRPAAARRA